MRCSTGWSASGSDDSEPGSAAPLEQRQALSGRAWRQGHRGHPDAARRAARRGGAGRSARRIWRRAGDQAAGFGCGRRHAPAASRTIRFRDDVARPGDDDPALPSLGRRGRRIFDHAVRRRTSAMRSSSGRRPATIGSSRISAAPKQPCAPPAGAIELAKAALAAAPAEAAYARVDMVRDASGALAIIELELIEPSLWLQHAPDGGAVFVSAAVRRAPRVGTAIAGSPRSGWAPVPARPAARRRSVRSAR